MYACACVRAGARGCVRARGRVRGRGRGSRGPLASMNDRSKIREVFFPIGKPLRIRVFRAPAYVRMDSYSTFTPSPF